MTRDQMTSRIASLLVLSQDDQAYADPFAIDYALNRVADEFAGPGMDCFYTSETSDLTAEQADYCAPHIYKLTGVYWLDASGNWNVLTPTTPATLDQRGASWRTQTSSANPALAVFEGVNRIQLYPKPNFTRAQALRFEGYAQTSASGISLWPALTAECPLPAWAHDGVIYGAACELAMSMLASNNPQEAAKATRLLPVLEGRYRGLRGKAEKAACDFHAQTVDPRTARAWRGWGYR